MPTGLRERKKQRTKAAIADAALELFLARGFDQTTVVEIAEAADVSPRTFFTYFPTKEEVVFDGHTGDLDAMRERLAQRRPGESAVDALQGWIAETMAAPDFSNAAEVERRKLIHETPALVAYESAHVDTRFREILVEAVAADLGTDRGELAPQMVAAAASAALRAMVDFYADSEAGHDPAELLEQAARFLDAGLASLASD